MPHRGITMKMKPEVILGQQLAVQADRDLDTIDKSLNPVTGIANHLDCGSASTEEHAL
jgi:hypothetical protein